MTDVAVMSSNASAIFGKKGRVNWCEWTQAPVSPGAVVFNLTVVGSWLYPVSNPDPM
jgi:hypothetical protein